MPKGARAEQSIRWVYQWLRWSVFITVPWMIVDLVIFEAIFYPMTDEGYALAVLFPALAHLILLFGLNSPHLYARRHAQQALVLVGLRALSALFFVGLTQGSGACLWIIVSGFLWLWGSTWGLRQIKRGDCWLMRQRGENDELPRPWALPTDAVPPTTDAPVSLPSTTPTETIPTAPEPEPKLAPTPKPVAPMKATLPSITYSPPETSADPNDAFEEGLRLLSTDKRTQAIDSFLTAFRTGSPDLRGRALIELEKLGEVETF